MRSFWVFYKTISFSIIMKYKRQKYLGMVEVFHIMVVFLPRGGNTKVMN